MATSATLVASSENPDCLVIPSEQSDAIATSATQLTSLEDSDPSSVLSYEGSDAVITPPVQVASFEISESLAQGLGSRPSDVVYKETVPVTLTSVQETQPLILDKPKSVQLHDSILSKALQALIDKNIPVMEYGLQISYRWGWEEVLMDVEWAVPDELLAFASQTLTESGFPWTPKPQRRSCYLEGWVNLCQLHNSDAAGENQTHLYPLSSLGLNLEDTFEVASTFDRNLRLLTPKPPRYMLSMIRHLLNFPVGDPMRHRVISDLAGFMHGYIFHGPPANEQYNTAEEEAAAEREFMKKVPNAIQEIRSWEWGDVPDKEYLEIAESIVRDSRKLRTITKL